MVYSFDLLINTTLTTSIDIKANYKQKIITFAS